MDTASARRDNPFKPGEQAVHERLGIRERKVGLGQRVIRTAMSEQHQRFFEQLPFMLVGSLDGAGRPWASMLVGKPGFVQAQGGQRLDFHARPVVGDPLAEGLTPGAQMGFLGIELHTRRRNRVNGHVVAIDAQGFSVAVDQSVGNCPRVGDTIEALGPRGQFTINAKSGCPAVLIGAGVGITPMVAFARHLVTEGFRNRRMRPLHLIQLAHSEAMRAFGVELQVLRQRAAGAMHLHVVLGSGEGAPEDALKGPLTIDLLKSLLPFVDHEFFLCGPSGFMQALYDGLRDLGVRDASIQAEAFGPSSLKRRPDGLTAPPPPPEPPAREATVIFARSGDAAEWTPGRGTLLEFAEGKGLDPPFSCRAGHCGSCATRLIRGRVTYAEPTAWRPAEGEVLLCCAVPAQGGGERTELDL